MEKAKTTTLILVLVLLLIHIAGVDTITAGLSDVSPTYTRFTYQFIHASWLHLACNVWALLGVIFLYDLNMAHLVTAYIVSVTVPATQMPTVGISGVVFALFAFASFRSAQKLKFHIWTLSFIIAGFFISGVSAFNHLHCYLVSLVLYFVYDSCRRHIAGE